MLAEAVELSVQEEEELSTIYTNPLFPLSRGRYPVCQFIKQEAPLHNNKLLKTNEEEMGRLKGKFSALEKLVQEKLKSDTLMNSE